MKLENIECFNSDVKEEVKNVAIVDDYSLQISI